jgi:hypothetical protein
MRRVLLLAAFAGALGGGLLGVAPTLAGDHAQRAARGPKGDRGTQGPVGPQGPAATDVVRSLSLNWRRGASSGRDTASVAIPSIGTLVAVCRPGEQRLLLYPAQSGVRTTASVTTFQSTSSDNATSSSTSAGSPLVVADPLPPNGMLSATLSVQPVSGDGGPGPAPATLVLSSESVVNGLSATDNFCFVSGQVLQAGG